jgi:hypothetical protein
MPNEPSAESRPEDSMVVCKKMTCKDRHFCDHTFPHRKDKQCARNEGNGFECECSPACAEVKKRGCVLEIGD